MFQLRIDNFDIQKICYSGQCFRMKERDTNTYEVVAFGNYLEISQRENVVTFSCTKEEYKEVWEAYFGLNDDYDSIAGIVMDEDIYMKNAMTYGWGIRILKQELWETIISFIISQQNNIPRIKKSIELICERYGDKKYNYRNEVYYTFPSYEIMANLSDNELKECNLGYRGKYIVGTARAIVEGKFKLEDLQSLSYEEAKRELLKLYGVGIKVSECICLYALHHFDAFPIDTHIQKVLDENYPGGFPFDKYRGFVGPLQQYAFYYDLFVK